MALKTSPFHASLIRPNLVLGCDRELIMFSGLIAFTLIFTTMALVHSLAGAGLWLISLCIFRRMAKADPLMRFVYLRHRRYQSYYPPRSTPFRANTRTYR